MSYGYFHYKNHGVVPQLSFLFISTRNKELQDLSLELDIQEYEEWVERRLNELVDEALRAEKGMIRRQKISRNFLFPFEKPRLGQIELIESIEKGFEARERLMVQAPTGLGKTMGVLYPSLKESLSRGHKVIYVTPKNSQHSVAEDAIEKFQDKGCQVKSLTITAKSKMCLKAEPLCNPEYCEFAKDYYDKLHKEKIKELISKKRKLTAKVFKTLGEKYQVCPFELQVEAIEESDTIICDYNYVFGDKSSLGRLANSSFFEEGKPNLVIDEAHNLPSRAMGYYSPALSSLALEKMREDIKALPKKLAKECESLLNSCLKVIQDCRPQGFKSNTRIKLEFEPFAAQNEELRSFLTKYLDSETEIKPRDVVLRLIFYWGEFTDIIEKISLDDKPEFFITFQSDRSGGDLIKITCCDASEMIKDRYDNFENVVAFSATLKPFDFYTRLSGLNECSLRTVEFESPFEKKNRKLLVIPQVSTKFSERERNYSKIADVIHRISKIRSGNYISFFPSFDFLYQVANQFVIPPGVRVIKQDRFMKNTDVENILKDLKENDQPTMLFAVQGGVFSEGVDYAGDMLIGAFIVGPPLPSFDIEREGMKEYYQDHYQEGFDYAYSYPAMAKAIQSAGRVIRSETDKGLIVLMDNRFLEKSYSKSMPRDWFTQTPRELVSESILNDVEKFWRES
jgi:DNA excision repair protein ERCC-2